LSDLLDRLEHGVRRVKTKQSLIQCSDAEISLSVIKVLYSVTMLKCFWVCNPDIFVVVTCNSDRNLRQCKDFKRMIFFQVNFKGFVDEDMNATDEDQVQMLYVNYVLLFSVIFYLLNV
jgi:hypothetical protein